MYYVYLLISQKVTSKVYIGTTGDVKKRVQEHNRGNTAYASRYAPWKLRTYLAFRDQRRAIEFEKYLKSGSGHAFLKKRLL